MTREEFLTELKATYEKGISIIEKKNADYASSEDPFKNFRFSHQILGSVTTEDAIVVRILDKIARLGNVLHRPHAVADEKLDDTILDAINYLAILRVYLQHEGNVPVPSVPSV